jgi:2-polyprenyl-3-methyl-5-hydroxy-6-metoxy-1,4-benzoquinol methylase
MGTDQDWEKWGATDPYFGVYSDSRFRRNQIKERDREAFFQTGREHVDHVLSTIRRVFNPAFAPSSGLDFGCGVGRLVIPMAAKLNEVTGLDISISMLAEAAKNCRAFGVANVDLVIGDDALSRITKNFDLINSCVVLQHIPWRRGRRMLRALADHVEPGGYLAIQLLIRCNANALSRSLTRLRYVLPPIQYLWNLLRSRPLRDPAMQLHVYALPELLLDLRTRGFFAVHIEVQSSSDGDFETVMLYAERKPELASPLAPQGHRTRPGVAAVLRHPEDNERGQVGTLNPDPPILPGFWATPALRPDQGPSNPRSGVNLRHKRRTAPLTASGASGESTQLIVKADKG